jgi:hypothetical protein
MSKEITKKIKKTLKAKTVSKAPEVAVVEESDAKKAYRAWIEEYKATHSHEKYISREAQFLEKLNQL